MCYSLCLCLCLSLYLSVSLSLSFSRRLDSKADDCLCSLSAFELSYSLNGRTWY